MPEVTLSYSQTGNFGYLTQEIETKTITWTISSSLPIQHGTFLDGTPWVMNNGDINLIATTPVAENVPIKTLRKDPYDAALGGYPITIVDLSVDINNTIINPDLGKYTTNSKGDTVLVGTVSGATLDRFFPFDGRAGRRVNVTNALNIGTKYDNTQKWNRQQTRLNTGDMVTVCYSHYIPLQGNEQIISGFVATGTQSGSAAVVRGIFDGVGPGQAQAAYDDTINGGVMDFIGCLTVVGSIPTAKAFRPPFNWDKTDRANAPMLEEVNDLEDQLVEYPNYSIGSNTKDWTTTAYTDYLGDIKEYNNIDPVMPYFLNDENGMWGYRRTRLSSSDPNQEYGSTTSKSMETSLWVAHTTDSTPEVRASIRRRTVQRGIDLWGARQSLGKYTEPNGGHSTHLTPLEILAYIVTEDIRIYDRLQGDFRGSVANGSFFDANRLPTYNEKLKQFNTLSQFTIVDPGFDEKYFFSPNRWKDLVVKKVYTGVSTTYGPYQVLRIKAPELLSAGVTFPEDISRFSSWTRNTLYNVSGTKIDTGRGRWNCVTNTGSINGSYFMGGYLRNGDRITRIIKGRGISKDAPIDTSLSSLETGFAGSNSNSDLLVWTQGDIFDASVQEGTVDMSPNLKNELASTILMPHTTYESTNIPYQYGYMAYKWNQINFLPFWIYYERLCIAYGIPIPYMLSRAVKAARWYSRDKLTLWTYFFAINVVYNNYQKWYMALFRKFLGNDQTPMPLPQTASPSIATWLTGYNGFIPNQINSIRAAWDPLPENPTWIEFFNPPPNITVAGGGPNTSSGANQVKFYTEGEGAVSVGALKPFYWRKDPDDESRFILEVSTSSSTAKLPYSYVNGKTLYWWFAGASKPLKLKKIYELKTSDTVWTQRWEIPIDKKRVVDFFANFNTIGDTTQRTFYADEDPSLEDFEDLPFAVQLARLLGAWGTNNQQWDLNNDGVVGSSDLSLLLAQWDAANDRRLLAVATDNPNSNLFTEFTGYNIVPGSFVNLIGTSKDGVYEVISNTTNDNLFKEGVRYQVIELGRKLRSTKNIPPGSLYHINISTINNEAV